MTQKYNSNQVLIDDVSSYVKNIKNYKRLTTEEETKLSEIIHSNNVEEATKAKNILVCSNLRLVVKIAHDFKLYNLPFSDIIAEGNLGLMKAAEKFEASKGVRFSCYASWWIKQAIRRAIINQSRTIRVPSQCAQKLVKLDKLKNSFEASNGRTPSNKELSELSGYSCKSIDNLDKAVTFTYSLDDTVSDSGDATFEDLLGVEESSDYNDIICKDSYSSLYQNIEKLPERLKRVIHYKFNINNCNLSEQAFLIELGLSKAKFEIALSIAIRILKSKL